MEDYPFDMGTYSWVVSTRSTEAQIWFDRGLNWIFGYNHAEATTCFENALSFDADFAMAYWGIAYCAGPNYNMPWELFDPPLLQQSLKTATDSVTAAKLRLTGVSPVEVALIEALEFRHPATTPPEDLYTWSHSYAGQMRNVSLSFPDDPDVATFYAEALMNLTSTCCVVTTRM